MRKAPKRLTILPNATLLMYHGLDDVSVQQIRDDVFLVCDGHKVALGKHDYSPFQSVVMYCSSSPVEQASRRAYWKSLR